MLREQNVRLQEQLEQRYSFSNIIGKSKAMQEVFDLIRLVADSDASVLVYGESGTGKEMVASAIHFNSPRRTKPYVRVSCASLPESLIESELFGYEKGAFTGASERRIGRFEAASGGTLFLDEIGELPLSFQVKLLRVLQERQIERLGSNRPVDVDVRIVSASLRPLEEEIDAGQVPRGPLLPGQHGGHRPAAAARAARGHSDPGQGLSAGVLPASGSVEIEGFTDEVLESSSLPLARQRARAAQRGRAGGALLQGGITGTSTAGGRCAVTTGERRPTALRWSVQLAGRPWRWRRPAIRAALTATEGIAVRRPSCWGISRRRCGRRSAITGLRIEFRRGMRRHFSLKNDKMVFNYAHSWLTLVSRCEEEEPEAGDLLDQRRVVIGGVADRRAAAVLDPAVRVDVADRRARSVLDPPIRSGISDGHTPGIFDASVSVDVSRWSPARRL